MHVHANPQVNACTTHSMHAPHTACMCMHMPNAIFRGRGGCPVQGTWVGGNHHACACTAEFLPHDSEKKVHVLAPGQMEHFEALIDVNEDEAAEENADEWAAVLRAANKHM